MRSGITLLVIAIALPLAGCGDDDEPTDTTTGIANPASVFCVEQGGTLEIVDEEGGQVGYCNLPDGRRIEEWEYYRSEGGDSVEP